MAKKISAGILLFRKRAEGLEVFLAHPGGPFYRNKDEGVWSVPKGEVRAGANLLAEAQRELNEETGIQVQGKFMPLGSVTQKSGKEVHAWAVECDWVGEIKSNLFDLEWPPKSGKVAKFPEVDEGRYFSLAEARQKINPAQAEFISRLEDAMLQSHRSEKD